MFSGCKLNAASVQFIAENLPEYQAPTISLQDLGYPDIITIHVNTSMSEEDKALVRAAFHSIQDKGWTVQSNISF